MITDHSLTDNGVKFGCSLMVVDADSPTNRHTYYHNILHMLTTTTRTIDDNSDQSVHLQVFITSVFAIS